MEPRNQFQGIDSASLCSLAGRNDNPIPSRFLALIDCSKIPAQISVENLELWIKLNILGLYVILGLVLKKTYRGDYLLQIYFVLSELLIIVYLVFCFVFWTPNRKSWILSCTIKLYSILFHPSRKDIKVVLSCVEFSYFSACHHTGAAQLRHLQPAEHVHPAHQPLIGWGWENARAASHRTLHQLFLQQHIQPAVQVSRNAGTS